VGWWRENERVTRPQPLDDPTIAARLAGLEGWTRDGDAIRKEYTCGGFADAIAFVVRIGFLAEAADHHPDIDVRWRKVTIALSTHDAGGLTTLDFDLAGRIDEVSS
jgi:4a-hydroxytetrahydrobiopterin dehydratase